MASKVDRRGPLLALGKTLQRRLLDVLSDRTSFLTLVVCAALVVASVVNFGEAWLEWSADKYNAVFNSFSDNIAGERRLYCLKRFNASRLV